MRKIKKLMKRTSSLKPFFSRTTLVRDFSLPSVNRQPKKNLKKVAQKPQYQRNQLVDYTRLNKLMVVTDISFHQYLKTYLYTLAVEDLEGLEPLFKLIPENELAPAVNFSQLYKQ